LITSAEQGDAESQLELAKAYLMGRGTSQDYIKASKWYEKAANQGNAAAQYYLGLMHKLGMGGIQNYAVAAEWYRKAADQGIVRAQYDLGVMYLQGNGVAQDYAEAAGLLCKPAEHGNIQAQCWLGAMYGQGKGIERDNVQAHKWLSLCIASGKGKKQEMAAKLRDEIAKQMGSEQIAEAQKMAREWEPATKSTSEAFWGFVQESKLIRKADPVYPELAKRTGVTGSVILSITIDEEGNVSDIRISSGHPALTNAAINAVKQWRYSPTLLNGVPVSVTATVSVHFNLKYR
jgi:TonB family protein